jgi:hypothetical protein
LPASTMAKNPKVEDELPRLHVNDFARPDHQAQRASGDVAHEAGSVTDTESENSSDEFDWDEDPEFVGSWFIASRCASVNWILPG